MIFHYAGKYNGDESSLPYKEHHPNATPFKEPEDTKKLSLIANGGCILIMGILAIPFLILGIEYIPDNAIWMMIGGICGGLSLLPHELLHAICYKKDVYMYNDLAHGLMFVVGTEDMSKGRFIFTCLCPNLIKTIEIVPTNFLLAFLYHFLSYIPNIVENSIYFIFDISAICWIGFIWNYLYRNGVWGLLKYLQCNKANAEKF